MRWFGRVWVAAEDWRATLHRRPTFFAVLIVLLSIEISSGSDSAPRWLEFKVDERARLETVTGNDFRSGASDAYLLNRLRFQTQARAANWLRFHLHVLDARVWGLNVRPGPSVSDSADIRQASVELGGGEGSRFGLHAGRQPIHLGEGRLIGDPGWGNVGRTFDAIRVKLRTGNYKLDIFSASVVQVRQGKLNRSDRDCTIHGAYLTAARVIPASTIEPYFFWKRVDSKKHDVRTVGTRWAGTISNHFDSTLEAVLQTGAYGADRIAAWGWRSVFGYTVHGDKKKVRLYAEYNYASGDRDGADGRRGTFDELYPSTHDRFGMADQIMWCNMRNTQGGVEFPLLRALRMKAAFTSLWLAESADGLYRGGQRSVVVADGSGGRHVGEEIDLQGAFPIGRKTQIATGFGRLYPGHFLKTANRRLPLNFYFLSVSRTF
jgi:hypothetical protein